MPELDKIFHNVHFYDYVPSVIQKIAYDEKSKTLAVARGDNNIELWNCSHQPFRQEIIQCAGNNLECLVWCGGQLYTGHLDGSLREHLQTQRSKEEEEEKQQQSSRTVTVTGGVCWSLAANEQDNLIVAGTEGGYVCLYSVQEGGIHFERVLEKLSDRVLSLSWLPCSRRLIAASGNRLHLCSLAPTQVRSMRVLSRRQQQQVCGVVWCVAALPDGTMVSGDSRGVVSFWCSTSCTQISAVTSHRSAVLALAVGNLGNTIYAAGVDPTIRLITRSDDDGRWSNSRIVEVHTHDVRSLALDSDGRVYSGGLDCRLGVHRFPPKTVWSLPPCPAPGGVSVSGDSLLLACPSEHLQWWRLGRPEDGDAEGTQRLKLEKDRCLVGRIECRAGDCVLCCALSPAATVTAYATQQRGLRLCRIVKPKDSEQGRLQKIKVTGSDAGQPGIGGSPVRLLQWLTEETLVALTGDGTVQLWHVEEDTASLRHSLTQPALSRPCAAAPERILMMAASQCGSLLATASATRCVLHRVEADTATAMPEHTAAITSVCVRTGSAAVTNNSDRRSLTDSVTAVLKKKATRKRTKSGSSSFNVSQNGLEDVDSSQNLAGTVVVAYADQTVCEYDALTGLMTPFGRRLRGCLTGGQHVVTGISWDEAGEVLCLHDSSRLVFLSRLSVLEYDWDAVPTTKKQRQSEGKSREAASSQLPAVQTTLNGGVLDDNENIRGSRINENGSDKSLSTVSDVTKDTRRYQQKVTRIRGPKVDPMFEVWRSLSSVVNRESIGNIVHAQQTAGQNLVLVELTHEAVRSHLSAPLHIPRFGAK